MDYTSGIGGLNVEKDESVDSNFGHSKPKLYLWRSGT